MHLFKFVADFTAVRQLVETQRTSRVFATRSRRGPMAHSHILVQWRTIFRGWTFQPDVGRMAKSSEARESMDTSASEFAKSKFHPPTGHTRADLEAEVSTVPDPAIWSINKNWLNAIILVPWFPFIRVSRNFIMPSSQLQRKQFLLRFCVNKIVKKQTFCFRKLFNRPLKKLKTLKFNRNQLDRTFL